MKVFDFLNSINFDKKNLIKESENPDLAEKIYVPYIINKSLSYFIDTVRLSNEMNINHHLDNKLQFEFFLNIVRKQKRFAKWHKEEKYDDLELVKSYFQYNTEKAKQALAILTPLQLDIIRQKQQQGGLSNGGSK